MKTVKFALMGALLAVASMASAQEDTQLMVSTGSPTGTYSRMFKEFQGMCKNQIMQVEKNSTGSVQNMDRLLGNEVNAAIVQTDVLYWRARNENLASIKTLFALHPEEVHVITPSVSPIKEGGMVGIGKKPIQLGSVQDLAGRSVAAWGGGFVTAQVIRMQAEINFQVVEVENYKAAMELLNSGQVAAIVMVGGHPMSDVAALNSAYKLLPFPEAIVAKLKNVYVPAKLTYSGMGAGASGVPTVATEALFVTRQYRTPRMVNALSSLRACMYDKLPDLQETTGMHKKWADVKAENQGKWAYYELPATQVQRRR